MFGSNSSSNIPNGFHVLQPSVLNITKDIALTMLPPYDKNMRGFFIPLNQTIPKMTLIQHRCYVGHEVPDVTRAITLDQCDLITYFSNVKPSWPFIIYEDLLDLRIVNCKHSQMYETFLFSSTDVYSHIFTFSSAREALRLFYGYKDSADERLPLVNESNTSIGEQLYFDNKAACDAALQKTSNDKRIKKSRNYRTTFIVAGIIMFLAFSSITFIMIFALRKKTCYNTVTQESNIEQEGIDENSGIYDTIEDGDLGNSDAYQHPTCRENTQSSYSALNEAATTRGLSDAGYLPMGFGRAQAPIATQDEDEYVPMQRVDDEDYEENARFEMEVRTSECTAPDEHDYLDLIDS